MEEVEKAEHWVEPLREMQSAIAVGTVLERRERTTALAEGCRDGFRRETVGLNGRCFAPMAGLMGGLDILASAIAQLPGESAWSRR